MLRPLAVITACLWLSVILGPAFGNGHSMELFTGLDMTQQPTDVKVVGQLTTVKFRCRASTYPSAPSPSYEWFSRSEYDTNPLFNQLVNDDLHSIYFDGVDSVLEISVENFFLSRGPIPMRFQCRAYTYSGSIMSRVARLSFGVLGEFPGTPMQVVNVTAYERKILKCPNIYSDPGVTYSWYIGNNPYNIVSERSTPTVFSSATNGRLYFSSLSLTHSGTYHCVVNLTAAGSGYELRGKDAQASRSHSNGIFLNVASNPNPPTDMPTLTSEIPDDFLSILPTTPIQGDDVMLECFAYDTTGAPVYYRWIRRSSMFGVEWPLPAGYSTANRNRTLTLHHIQTWDNGTYECVAESYRGSDYWTESRSTFVQVKAKPGFTRHMEDQLAVEGQTLTLECHPWGAPPPEVNWFKDGVKVMDHSDSRFTSSLYIYGNKLEISFFSGDMHAGLYQCGASNYLGTAYDTVEVAYKHDDNGNSVSAGAQCCSVTSAAMVVMAMTMTYFL
ncbi:contactin-5 [Aplysia californica]|uniref:Contactin-5 n=1 Tax=Aplysia californica TaxID=6500 RepID=A0ABM1ACF7_APLCA|nr:contactin-5 [Aplysia californica]